MNTFEKGMEKVGGTSFADMPTITTAATELFGLNVAGIGKVIAGNLSRQRHRTPDVGVG